MKKIIKKIKRMTPLEIFEEIFLYIALAAFWTAFVAVFILKYSSDPRREAGIIVGCIGIMALYIAYNKQKERNRIEECEKECKNVSH